MDKVRVGIVGLGNMGSAHAVSIFSGNIKGLELAAVCDIDKAKCLWAKDKFPLIPIFEAYLDLLNSDLIDAIIIATPHYLHPDIAVKAFECGKHVLTEKPAGVYTKQVEQMNAAAIQSGKVFCIMFNQRTNQLFQKARELVQGGRLGEPKRFVWIITNWYRTQSYYNSSGWRASWEGEGGGVLINQAPHNLDLWQWIFGMPKRVRAFCGYGKYHNIEVEDDATIYAEYENGAVASFITSTGEAPGTNRLEISGDRGKIVIEDGKLRFWELSVSEREFCFASDQIFDSPPMTYSEFIPEANEIAHNGILQNFADSILQGKELLAPGIDGLNELTISNAAYLSDWTQDWVELPMDGDVFKEMLEKHYKNSGVKHISEGISFTEEGDITEKCDITEESDASIGKYKDRWSVRW